MAKGDALREYDRRAGIVLVTEHSVSNAEHICGIYNEPSSWMDLIIMYLQHRELLENKNEARTLRIRAARYALIGNHSCRKSFTGPYLRCLKFEDARRLLRRFMRMFVVTLRGSKFCS